MPTIVYEIVYKKKHVKLLARDVDVNKWMIMENVPAYQKEEEGHVLMTFLVKDFERNNPNEKYDIKDFSISNYWTYEKREEAENAIMEFYNEPMNPI